jgi:hypothetical protein
MGLHSRTMVAAAAAESVASVAGWLIVRPGICIRGVHAVGCTSLASPHQYPGRIPDPCWSRVESRASMHQPPPSASSAPFRRGWLWWACWCVVVVMMVEVVIVVLQAGIEMLVARHRRHSEAHHSTPDMVHLSRGVRERGSYHRGARVSRVPARRPRQGPMWIAPGSEVSAGTLG